MKIQAIVYHKNTWRELNVEACLVPGLPVIEILGLSANVSRRIQFKLKIWLRMYQIVFPRNRRLLIHLSADLRGEVVGIELAIWLALLSLHRKKQVSTKADKVFGDYDLQAKPMRSDLLQRLEQQRLKIFAAAVLPRDLQTYDALSSTQTLSVVHCKRYLCLNFSTSQQNLFLHHIQEQTASVVEQWGKQLQPLEARKNKVIYANLYRLDAMKMYSDLLSLDDYTFVLFANLCPCGKSSLIKRQAAVCAYTKADCQSYIKHLRLLPMDRFDAIFDAKQAAGKDLSTLLTSAKTYSSQANRLLIRSRLDIPLK